MKYYSEHFKKLCKKLDFPDSACIALSDVAKRLDNEADFGEKFYKIIESYMISGEYDLNKALLELKALGAEKDVHEYTINMVFLIECSEILLARYIEKGYGEELFWLTIADLRYKLIECMECKNIVGTFVADWFDGFFKLNRFALGRFQYEESTFPDDIVTENGVEIKKGARCFCFHIPSSGVPITDEARFDSYKKAYSFYKNADKLTDGKLILFCGSWLLYPRHREFLPKNSNILKFMDDFYIYGSEETEIFYDGWRVFGEHSELPVQQLPADTSLRKAYKEWMLNGNHTGFGKGVIVFDGEKIISHK